MSLNKLGNLFGEILSSADEWFPPLFAVVIILFLIFGVVQCSKAILKTEPEELFVYQHSYPIEYVINRGSRGTVVGFKLNDNIIKETSELSSIAIAIKEDIDKPYFSFRTKSEGFDFDNCGCWGKNDVRGMVVYIPNSQLIKFEKYYNVSAKTNVDQKRVY